jgi:cytochrome P450
MNEEQHDDWNPLDASILKDQRRAYDEMRERCPVAHSEFMGWSLFRHEDIATVLADPEKYSNVSRFLAIPNGIDPPVHGRYREALDPNFDREQMARVEPRAREIAAMLLGPMLSGGEVEFIEAFANPFALKTLCALLGWPEQQWECLGGWVHGSQQAAFNKDPVAGKALASLFSEHVKANLDTHRASPNHVADATDALLSTDVDGVRLDDDQIVSILRNWTAGHGTVAAGLGIWSCILLRRPNFRIGCGAIHRSFPQRSRRSCGWTVRLSPTHVPRRGRSGFRVGPFPRGSN